MQQFLFKSNFGCDDTHLTYEKALEYLKECGIEKPQLKLMRLRQQKIRFINLVIGDYHGHLRNIDD
jgi:hypothetical protein